MRNGKIMEQMDSPKNVEDILGLARYGAGVLATIKPRFHKNHLEPGRKHPSFRLDAIYSVKIGGRTSTFEKTYAKGHEVTPPKSAANGFMIANTRLHRDVKKLKKSGVKCEVYPFILAEFLPETDTTELEPRRPYFLDQFAILASIGIPVDISMTTDTRRFIGDKGEIIHELYAVYAIHCRDEDYLIETRHGQFLEGADEKTVDRVHEVARYRLEMEQHKLRRVGVEINMGLPWGSGRDIKRSLALIKKANDDRKGTDEAKPSLQVVQR